MTEVANKRIGILFGMEDTFPWALMNEINTLAKKSGDAIECGPVKISHLTQEQSFEDSVILDRISHEVPFYRTFLKCAVARGVDVVNNPIWWSADDKFFDNVVALAAGVAVPKTVLLPHKERPPNTTEKSYRNLEMVDWDRVFSYLGFPIFLKPANGGGWKDVCKCDTPDEFFAAYDKTRDLEMMAQEAIEFTDYYRCYVVGREHVRIMGYAPKEPHHLRYAAAARPSRARGDGRTRDGGSSDAVRGSGVRPEHRRVRRARRRSLRDRLHELCARRRRRLRGPEELRLDRRHDGEFLLERAKHPRPFESLGTWPRLLGIAK